MTAEKQQLKTVLITGAGSGIGLETARVLLGTKSYRIALLGRNKAKLEEARIKIRNERQKMLDSFKGLPEDEEKRKKNELQKSVDEGNRKLDELYSKKEAELLE